MPRSTRAMMPRRCGAVRAAGNSPHNAGESVSAFSAEISIAALIVTANCLNSTPEMPGMKPIGTNTDSSTSVMAMIGAVICRIASFTASAGIPVRMLLHHAFDVLDHHDRVVHHDADGQHHRQQGHRIGGKAERQQHGERRRSG